MRSPLFLCLCIFVTVVKMTGCNNPPKFVPEEAIHGNVSGERAFEHVKNLVEIGPRPSGTQALELSRRYIENALQENGWRVRRQAFKTRTPEGAVEFINLVARFGESEKVFETPGRGLICSHYDTKRFAGFEFVGANDAGSSTGLLIELARVLAEKPEVARYIELVFFDGEESFGTNITRTDGLYGSKYYAKKLILVPEKKRPKWGVLLDMVGDRDLKIRAGVQIPGQPLREMPDKDYPEHTVDMESVRASLDDMAKWLLQTAEELGHRDKIGVSPNYITDDHIPLNVAAGIPTIDLIDFDFDYWHTPGDTLDKISVESLEISGKAALLLVEKYLLPEM